MAEWSPEATHATQMLDQILSRVRSPDQRGDPGANPQHEPSASSTPTTGGGIVGERAGCVDVPESSRGANSRPFPIPAPSDRQGVPVANARHPPTKHAEGWSREWDMGRLDEIRERVARDLGDPSEGASDLDIDWVSTGPWGFTSNTGGE